MTDAATGQSLDWLLDGFAGRVPGVRHAVLVSSDGLVMACSQELDRDSADRFAAVASGLIGLAYGAAGRFGGGRVNEVIVEMAQAFLFVSGVSDGSSLAVLAAGSCDVGLVAYEMALLAERAGEALTPQLRGSGEGPGRR